jgi:V8-like Glu-specific endopeptidase
MMDEPITVDSHGTGEVDVHQLTASEYDRLTHRDPVAVETLDETGKDIIAPEVLTLGVARARPPINDYPFRAIACVEVALQPGQFPRRGTAFFVSKNVLVTSAHNIPPNFTSIAVYVKLDGIVTAPFVTTRHAIAPTFAGDSRSDYAAIFLAQDVGSGTGFFVVPPSPSLVANGSIVHMSGYPIPGLRQMHGSGAVTDINASTLTYDVDTEDGDSGSPVYIDAFDPILVGIHRADNGRAVPVTSAVASQIRTWIAMA